MYIPITWSFYFVFSFWLFWEWGLYAYSFCEYLQFCYVMKVLVWCEKKRSSYAWRHNIHVLWAKCWRLYQQPISFHVLYDCKGIHTYIYRIGTLHVLHKHESTMVNWLEVHTSYDSYLTPNNATCISAILEVTVWKQTSPGNLVSPLWIWALRTQGAHFHPVQKGELAKTAPGRQRKEWEVGCNPHISHVL